jgi:hypothetical protein
MKSNRTSSSLCPDCDRLDRREFIRASATGVAAAAVTVLPFGSVVEAADKTRARAKGPTSETLVAQLYQSLSEEQRGLVCFPFGHEFQSRIDNNWFITKSSVSQFSKDQQQLIRDIFHGLHSEEYARRVMQQVEHDNGAGGFGKCAVALFGQPGTGKFEFVLTGRHVTRRCDGDSVAGAAFGGPIFYGHQAGDDFDEKPDHPGNAYWYQAKRANEVFQMLDGRQRKLALLDKARPERKEQTVKLSGKNSGLEGIPMTELTRDQKNMVRKVMTDVLAPFRAKDAEESMKLVEKNGFDHLHMAFYKGHDVGNDGVWDVWQIEGPAMIWYFRGDPHVHTWVHIRETA